MPEVAVVWHTVLLLSAPDIGDTLNPSSGHGGHLPADELLSDEDRVSLRGVCAQRDTSASSSCTSVERNEERRAFFVYVVPA